MGMMKALGKLTPSAFGQRSYDATIAAGRTSGRSFGQTVGTATQNAERAMKYAKRSYAAGGVGLIGASTSMRPNSNQSRTSYRGPMQTGRGSGRYA